ncbi:MAG: hypothetical protein ACE5F1_00310 [Planctomycetota bacterium]
MGWPYSVLAPAGPPAGIPLFPGTGRAYLSPLGLLGLGVTTLDAWGKGRIMIVRSIPPRIQGTIHVQALSWNTGFTRITLSNSQGFTLL